MLDTNVIILMGHLVEGNPEVRQTNGGTPVATFNLAVNRPRRKGQDTGCDFFNVVVYGATATFVGTLPKGTPLKVFGSMQSRKWQDKDDNNRISWEVQADRIETAGPRPQNDDQPDAQMPVQ